MKEDDAALLADLERGTFRLTLTDERGSVVDVNFSPFTLAGLDKFTLVAGLVGAIADAARKATEQSHDRDADARNDGADIPF